MHRRRHRGLSTVGGPFSRLSPPPRPPEDPDLFLEPTQRFLLLAGEGWSPGPGPCLVSDSEDDKLPQRPALGDAGSPRVVPESKLEETGACSDVLRPQKRCHTSVRGHLQDVAAPCPDPDVRGPRKHQFGPQTTPGPDVGKKMAIPNVQPQNHSANPKILANPDVKHLEGSNVTLNIASNTGVKVPPRTGLFNPNHHRPTMKVSSNPDVEERGPDPDVGCPESHKTAPGDPDVKTETTDRDVEGRRTLLVESDTDVEEDTSNPDVEPPKTHRATQNVPRNPRLEMESPNPHAEGPRNKLWTIVVDSDTDVEENEVNPDVGHPKIHRIVCRDPDVEGETPNPSVKEPQKKYWNLELDSDTDIEEDWSQAALCPKSHKTPQNTRKVPTVVMETPNPDVGGLSRGSVASNGDSDTDVEDLDALPKVGAPKTRGTTPEVTDTVAKMSAAPDVDPEGRPWTNANPDVKVSFPNPDAGALKAKCPLLDVGSDTDVEANGVIPDVGTVQGCQGASGDSDVAVMSPNPDVSPPASPRESSDTDVEMLPPSPDVRGLRSRIRFQNPPHRDAAGPTTGRDTDVKETARKRRKLSPKRQGSPPKSGSVAGMLPKHHDLAPNPAVEAPNPGVGAERRDTETPVRGKDSAVPPEVSAPKSPRLTPNLSDAADTDGGPRSSRATDVAVTESDTEEDPDVFLEPTQSFLPPAAEGVGAKRRDVEAPVRGKDSAVPPEVSAPKSPRLTPNLSDAADTNSGPRSSRATSAVVRESDTEGWSPGPGPCLVSDSEDDKLPRRPALGDAGSPRVVPESDVEDTDVCPDVEERGPDPDVGCPESHKTAPGDPDVKTETTDRDVEGRRTLLVESDTDVEEDTSNPDVEPPKTHRATQNVPRNPRLEMESPNPHAEGPQNKLWTIVVDSDTDVEENEVNPDIGHPKIHRIVCRDPDVEGETPNPSVKEPQKKYWNLELDSDTDIEEDWSQAALCPKSHKTPQNTRKVPTVVTETPNPDVGGLSRGSVASNGDSDTDVEDLDALPKVGAPKTRGTTPEVTDTVAKMSAAPDVDPEGRPRTNANPDVKLSFPNPEAGALKAKCPLLDVGSDTDVEANGVIPDVGTVQGCQGASGDSDVAVTSPNPDVSPPASPRESSDTDVEMLPPSPDVRGLRSRIRFQNPPHRDAAGPTTGRDTDVKETARKRRKLSPKRQGSPPKSGSVAGMLPKHHDLAPNPAVEAPNPGVGAERRDTETPVRGKDPAVPPEVSAPKSPRLTPNLSDAADTDGGPRSSRATDVAVTESDTEEDPDVFLEPTQSFLPPAAEGTALGWDPEQPTQLFCPPEEEEEEEEEEEQPPREPPQEPPAAWVPPAEPVMVTPAQEGTGTAAAPSEDVGEGPRRSQRLARSRGGGASGEGGASRVRGGAPAVAAPVRRSPRLQARPPLSEPLAMKGRGQVETRPPAKPRPCRAGPGPSQRQAQEKEKELPEVTGPQLRPRGGPGSVPPKVLFTGVAASPEMEVALRTLGGSMATSVFDCTHLVTDRVRRTVKFLCAVARGVPIVTPEWLHKSTLSGHILVPDPFLVRDSQQERHFGFSLAEALRRARHHPLLQGYEVHVTPSVHPEPELMRDIVTCSGGTFLPTMPHTYGPQRLVISCEADKGCWAPALGARLPLVSAELLLTGLLRQQLQLQPFLLLPATPPRSHGTPPNPLKVSTVPPGVLRQPPEDPQGVPGSPRESRKVSGRRSRNRRPPPRETSRGNRRQPAAPQ
ncbi:mediator of DNA damage checkpoint protein 1 isoform X4 [Buteo buteo]|uniref:mediator of DNA damage checkpoint protein 1 isoform X4 n=1 Tax=Buteo buteo TaxID=30397 RepID=UPI003EBBE0DD